MLSPGGAPAAPFPVRYRKAHPYESIFRFIEPGSDAFKEEKQAAQVASLLNGLPRSRRLPLSPAFRGVSPCPRRYNAVPGNIRVAEYDLTDARFEEGLTRWLDSLGVVRSARFFVLPHGLVRYEIASSKDNLLHYRVGLWKQSWHEGRLEQSEPVEETVVSSPHPLFRDITADLFGSAASFEAQLLKGVPYWRARLDSAAGIDVYGNNGIAVGDIDGDGFDEVYVCQPGGLPNRLYKNVNGRMKDITDQAGVGVLDDTTCALFLDLRNIGRQDLVVSTIHAPLLFLNQGDGTFRHKRGAFRFASPPQGTFTGMAAADFDRDGRLDLYVCTYIYYQSEDQYRYPTPYYDSQNGPPNLLFRNELTADGDGRFEDVTKEAGLDANNNRYSFAPAWCDFDGDGWPDLCVANDFGRNNLYKNDAGKFRDIAATAGVDGVGPGMSASWFDYDGSGRPSLYISNMWSDCGQRTVESPAFRAASDETLREAYRRHSRGNALYRNRGDGAFDALERAEHAHMGRWAWGSDGIDFDNDGTPEIYIACGMLTNPSETDLSGFFWREVVSQSPAKNVAAPAYENGWNALNQLIREDYSWNGREPNVLYARRAGRFYDFSGISGLDCAADSRAFAVTDLDNDGNLDLLLKSRLAPQVSAFQNHWGAGNYSIAFDLHGTRSNRDAIGARVEVTHAAGRVVRTLEAGSGYLSQHTKRLYFGLGQSEIAAQVVIRWPSGSTQTFRDLKAGSRYQIVEGSNDVKCVPFQARTGQPGVSPRAAADNQPRLESTWLLEPVPLPESRRGPGFLCLVDGEKLPAPAGVHLEAVDLRSSAPDVAAWYSLFRMYLFDYRAPLTLPLVLLFDKNGLVHKVYPEVPAATVLQADLKKLAIPDRRSLALPFAGRYYDSPQRNYFRLGAAFYWAGYPEQSLPYFEEARRRAPSNSKVQLAIGHIHLEAGRYADAREPLERAVALNPESWDGWTNLGSLEAAFENYPAAIRDFEKALSILPDSAFALVGAGQACRKLGDRQKSERMLDRALQIEPHNAEAANQLGLLLADQDRLPEAARYFQQAIENDREHTGALNNLGVLYVRMRKMNDAVAAFRYGIQIAPDEEVFYLNLARAYAALGELAKARDILRQLLDRKPESATAKKGLSELNAP